MESPGNSRRPASYLILPRGPDLWATQRSLGQWYQMSTHLVSFAACPIPIVKCFTQENEHRVGGRSQGQDVGRQDAGPSSASNKLWPGSKSHSSSETRVPPLEKSRQLHLPRWEDGREPSRGPHTDSLLPKSSWLCLQVAESTIVLC